MLTPTTGRRLQWAWLLMLPGLYMIHLVLQRVYTGSMLARPQDSLRPSETSEADYAHFAPPRPQRSSAASDTFADYKHAADCGVSSLSLHLPFEPLCSDKETVLAAMSNGGRPGYDAPYIAAKCDMRWYSTEEICSIMDRFSHVFLLGDSLMRHVTNALFILLRADLGFGGLTDWDMPRNEEKGVTTDDDCKCSHQFDKHECSNAVIYSYDWLAGNSSSSCGSRSFDVTHVKLLQWPLSDIDLMSITDSLPAEQPGKPYAFIYHHSFWNNVNVSETTSWIDQINGHLQSTMPWLTSALFPRLFMTANAGGLSKGLFYMMAQGNQALGTFEKSIEPILRQRDMDFLGCFNMSVQSTQPDGTHASMQTNLLKAMMVMNWLDKLDINSYSINM